MFRKPLAIAVFAATAVIATSAQAWQAGDFIIRGGVATVSPNVDSGELKANGAAIPNSEVGVNSNSQLGLAFAYMVTDSIAVELLAATPFKHTVKGKGTIDGLGDFAEVKHLPPTLSVQYYPMDSRSAFQPYAGVGLNYTFFFSEKFKSPADDAYRSLEFDNSVGLTAQLGFDYKLNEQWALNASVWYMDINTAANFKDGAGNKYKLKADLDPWVYMAGVSYKF